MQRCSLLTDCYSYRFAHHLIYSRGGDSKALSPFRLPPSSLPSSPLFYSSSRCRRRRRIPKNANGWARADMGRVTVREKRLSLSSDLTGRWMLQEYQLILVFISFHFSLCKLFFKNIAIIAFWTTMQSLKYLDAHKSLMYVNIPSSLRSNLLLNFLVRRSSYCPSKIIKWMVGVGLYEHFRSMKELKWNVTKM